MNTKYQQLKKKIAANCTLVRRKFRASLPSVSNNEMTWTSKLVLAHASPKLTASRNVKTFLLGMLDITLQKINHLKNERADVTSEIKVLIF